MNFLIITLKKVISMTLISCIIVLSCFSFSGCSKVTSEEINQQEETIPNVVSNQTLAPDDLLISTLRESLNSTKLVDNQKSNLDKIKTNFGDLKWLDNQYVVFENGLRCVFVPIVLEEEAASFLISMPDSTNSGFKSIIIELLSDEKEGDSYYSGSINYYNISGNHIVSYFYDNGMYIYSESSKSISPNSRKAGEYDDCNFNCVYSCFNELMTSDWVYGTICAIACVAWETGIGLYVCIVCIGGPALHCLDECCPNLIEN